MVTGAEKRPRDRRLLQPEKAGLTAAQTPIWLDALFFPDKPIANTGIVVALTGPLDTELFVRSLARVVAETDTLRIRLSMEREQVRQEVLALPDVLVEQRDFSASSDGERDARQWIDEQFWVPLNWNDFPLFRFFLAKVSPTRHLWVQKFNHLVIDAIGRHLLAQRTIEVYEALKNHLPPPPKPGAALSEILAAEDQYRRSQKYADDRNYWLEQFATLPDPLVQKDRRETERAKSGRARRLALDISYEQSLVLEAEAKSLGSSVPRLFLAFVHVVFARLYARSDIVLRFALHNRLTERFKRTIGLFTQNTPLRFDLDPGMPLSEALKQIDAVLADSRTHSLFPPAEMASMLQLARHESGLYDALVNFIPPPPRIVFEGTPVEISNLSSGFFMAWTITLTDLGKGQGARLAIDYDPGLIDEGEADRFSRCLYFLLTHEIGDGTRSIGKLPIVTAAERQRLVHDFNQTGMPVPEGATLASLCAEQAARTPDETAIICGEERITFAALHARAERLAHALVKLDIGLDSVVGVALPRSIDLIVCLLGIHKAGGAYLPLDPAYPAERISYIVDAARAPVIVTTRALSEKFPVTSAHVVLLDMLKDAHPTDATVELPRAQPENLAYILYTSGSTGKPKGVGVEHRNVVNLLISMRDFIGPEDLAGVLFATSFNFDISIYEIFMSLIFGGRMIIVENLLDVPIAHARDEVRLINTVPSLMDALLKAGSLPRNTRTINLAGEALPRSLADRIFAARPDVRLMNAYGPTETTIYSTAGWVGKEDMRQPAIGRPVGNTQIYVLDGAGGLLPEGATGELYIGGRGVSRGYRDRPEPTAERFPDNPFHSGRMYRTGDLVRWRNDGELEFAGRADNQVKIRGQRVELGEIEQQLLTVKGVASAVVTVRADKFGGNALHAYLVALDGSATRSLKEINAQLIKFLPRHMLPSTVTWLEKLPMTPNGKLDRRALPEPDVMAVRSVRRKPRGEYEFALQRIWKDVLQLQEIGVDEDFYELGGTSLQAFIIFARISAELSQDVPLTTLLSAPTVAELARRMEEKTVKSGTLLIPFRATGRGSPLFMVHGAWGHILFVRDLAKDLKSDRPVYGIQPPPLDGSRLMHRSVEAFAAEYLSEVRKIQPQGPYFLAGYSWGGHAAWEMAQMLKRQGEEVALLALIDTVFDGHLDVAGEAGSHRVGRHVAALQHQSLRRVYRYIASRAAKTARDVLARTRKKISHLPNHIRLRLGRPVPYADRKSYYGFVFIAASRNSRPTPYPGSVVMFNSRGLSKWQRDRWAPFALAGYRSFEIAAPHGEMFYPPYSTLLAAAFDEVLEAIESRNDTHACA